jgi:outer membrane cobalamin receptor
VQPVTLRWRASAGNGARVARFRWNPPGVGLSDWGARDAVIVQGLAALFLLVGSDSLPARPGVRPARSSAAAAPRAHVADTVTVLPEVRVERERVLSEARRMLPTAFVTDLRSNTSTRALENISELLSQAAGVRVTQYGGLGSFSTVSLRGAAPGQVSIFLDGVPLTSAAHGVVSLGDLPATAIERVEIFRGLGPLSLGVASPGGAINLVTVSAPGLREIHVARGSASTWEGRGSAGLERGPLGLLLHAGYQGSAGDYRYLDDNATDYNVADDSMKTRRNNRFDSWSALGSLTWQPRSDLRLRVREELFHKAQGLPGMGADPALSTRLSFLRALSLLELTREGAGWAPRATLRFSADRERSRFRDTRLADRGELGTSRHDADERTGAERLAFSCAWAQPAPWLALEGGGSLGRERFSASDAADGLPDPPRSRRLARGAMMSLQLRTSGERLVLHAARRWDRIEDQLGSLVVGGALASNDVVRVLDSPQLGARLDLGRGLEARANWARANRAPGFVELFGDQGSVTGNPALRPESAENRDAGAAWRGRLGRGEGAFEWARFRSDARDLVVFVKNSASSMRAQNFSRARIRGEEWSARLEWPGQWFLTAAWSWQSAINRGPLPEFWVGKRLPGRPSRQGRARLEWRAQGRPGLRAGAELEWIGDNLLDPYNLQRVPERRLAGASLSIAPFPAALRLTLEGKNLLDDRAVDVGGFPLPGRSVFLGCTWRLAANAGPRTER